MTRFILLAAFLSFVAIAQDVPPPPKSTDDGPSLEATMNFIGDKLQEIGIVNFVDYFHDNATGNDGSTTSRYEYTGVLASPDTCRIDYHFKQTVNGTRITIIDGNFSIVLRDVQQIIVEPEEHVFERRDTAVGHAELTYRIDPPLFSVTLKRPNQQENNFRFYDNVLANRVAKALTHAIELCGGGNKDPF